MKTRAIDRSQPATPQGLGLQMDAATAGRVPGVANVVLYSRNPAIGLKVLYCLSHAGVRVWIIAAKRSSYLRHSRYCRSFQAIEQPDPARHCALLAERINALNRQHSVDAVLGDDIASHAILHDLTEVVEAPVFAPVPGALLAACHDKWAFYSRLRAQGLPVPPSAKLECL